MKPPRPSQRDQVLADAGLAAHILHTLHAAGEPVSFRQFCYQWEIERPDETPAVSLRRIGDALNRLTDARVIARHGTNRIVIRSEVMLRAAAAQHQPDA